MTDVADSEQEMTPTVMAARYFREGYTPEDVMRAMQSRKIIFPTISEVLNEFMGRESMSVETLSDLSDVRPATIYRIMKKERNPTRNTILRIALSLALDFGETQALLKSGNCAPLSASRERDLVIMNGIENGMDYESVNTELASRDMPDLNMRF